MACNRNEWGYISQSAKPVTMRPERTDVVKITDLSLTYSSYGKTSVFIQIGDYGGKLLMAN